MTETSPITVKATATPVVMSEASKALMLVGFAVAADRFLQSDVARGAVIAASGVLATFAWGLWHRLRTYFALRFLADRVPDELAKVSK